MPGTVDLSKSPWLGSLHASGVNPLLLFCSVVIAWTALSACASIPMGQFSSQVCMCYHAQFLFI